MNLILMDVLLYLLIFLSAMNQRSVQAGISVTMLICSFSSIAAQSIFTEYFLLMPVEGVQVRP
jgi:hypothetical protein